MLLSLHRKPTFKAGLKMHLFTVEVA